MKIKSTLLPLALFAGVAACFGQTNNVPITQTMSVPNTGVAITPLAPKGARFQYLNPGLAAYPNDNVEFAMSAAITSDSKTLAVITSGDYGIYTATGSSDSAASTEWLFFFDISHGIPVQTQALQIKNTYQGLVFDPLNTALYVSGGRDDTMHIITLSNGVWGETATPVALGHSTGLGSGTSRAAGGISISRDGSRIAICNYENDSLSVLIRNNGTWSVAGEVDLRPNTTGALNSRGLFGGEYPFWVSIAQSGSNYTAYVSSIRDREIDVVNISTASSPTVSSRIALSGQPLKSTLDSAQAFLYVAEDQTDSIAVINTAANTLIAEQRVVGPSGAYPSSLLNLSGNNTNSVYLSPDGQTLYVTNGTTNNVAVVSVSTLMQNSVSANPVLGLIPTGQYPVQAIVTGGTGPGEFMYVINAKSPSGANPNHCHGSDSTGTRLGGKTSGACNASDQYTLQMTKAGLQFLLVPAVASLPALTAQVADNNNFTNAAITNANDATMNFLAQKIKHVIYIIKENRTYDQVLGDLGKGNGDPALTEWGARITPNQHAIANNFVDLDNFYDTSEVSYDGWSWSTSALAPDIVIRQVAVNYCFRAGLAYESEGDVRGINLNFRPSTLAANVLPGTVDTDAPDGPNTVINGGYLWNNALNNGLSFREYGADGDNIASTPGPWSTSLPAQTNPSFALLNNATNYDVFFRAYDLSYNDTYRYQEWNYDVFTRLNGNLPALSIVRLGHNHTGNYVTTSGRVNTTPEGEVADNDFAVGKLVQDIANSPTLKTNTLVFVIEDDAQNGGDHVDAHRSTAFIVGPYVKQGAVVSSQYNTISFVRTMESVLGLPPMHITDALAKPMDDVFDTTMNPASWSFTAAAAPILYGTELAPLLPQQNSRIAIPKSKHDGRYWAGVTKGYDFSKADAVDPVAYNRILWRGVKGDVIYPGDSSLAETRRKYKQALKGGTPVTKDADDTN